jgi:uncharacterized membrane protein YjgN (DUF898 family)
MLYAAPRTFPDCSRNHMTTTNAAPGPDPPFFVQTPGPVWFLGRDRDYWRLILRGNALLAVTLGIYRFWFITDQRRFLWSNTEVLGETLEYTGTARELLIGFLIAIAILIPIYGLIFAATLDLGLVGKLAGVIGFVLLSLLGQYAIYRARRYRLTRTIYRGVRFHQTGSAVLYALYASLFGVLAFLTLGLAYPWALAATERFKMRRTYLGNLQGRFEGTGGSLFLSGFWIWLVMLGPLIAAVAIFATQIDFQLVGNIFSDFDITDEDDWTKLFTDHVQFATLVGIGIATLVWPLIAGPLLYPVFQAIMLRWWASGLRFGELATHSDLRVGQFYGAYLSFVGWASVLSIVGSLLVATAIALIAGAGTMARAFEGTSGLETIGITGAVATVIIYVIMTLVYSAIYHVKIKLAVWRMVAQSINLTNPETLDTVSSVGAPASPVGEGLADALAVGGY